MSNIDLQIQHRLSHALRKNLRDLEAESVDNLSGTSRGLRQLKSCDTVGKFLLKLNSDSVEDISGVSSDIRSHIESIVFDGLSSTETMPINEVAHDVCIDYDTPIYFTSLSGAITEFEERAEKLLILASKTAITVYAKFHYYFAFGIVVDDRFIVLGLRTLNKNKRIADFTYTDVDEPFQGVPHESEEFCFMYDDSGLALFERSMPTSYMKLTGVCYWNNPCKNVPFQELINGTTNASFIVSTADL